MPPKKERKANDSTPVTAPLQTEKERIKIRYGETRHLKYLWNWPDNPNKMTQKEAADLKTSLRKFGVVDPPIIEEGNMIIGGNHRAGAILEIMGPHYEIPVTVITGLTHDEKIQLGLALNKIHGAPDSTALKNIIDTLEEPDQLLNLGFDVEDFKDLEVSLEVFSGTSEEDGFEVVEESKDRLIKCPACGHEFTKKRQVGSKKIRNEQ